MCEILSWQMTQAGQPMSPAKVPVSSHFRVWPNDFIQITKQAVHTKSARCSMCFGVFFIMNRSAMLKHRTPIQIAKRISVTTQLTP